ncbi:unnamed protein product [Ceutorhynchus assimilis]|uniref:Uncharacterized protein n=1 Tax=Ceutorhynchus assimilis TaxID=467358 RepID=A0A9N9MST0_9CUCU|nr:unnamed protein product [Ceutorhynchus assimilis]
MKRTRKKTLKTEVCYPTHTVKHNLTLSKRYRIREGSVENKIKELEDRVKQQRKLKSKMFKTKRITYPTLIEHAIKKGRFNTITVENKDPEKPPFQWQPLSELKIEVIKHEPEEEKEFQELCEALEAKKVVEEIEGLIKTHPSIEHPPNKEVKMKLKNQFMQLLINHGKKRQTPPTNKETNDEMDKKLTKLEESKSCKAEENVEEIHPNEVGEIEQATQDKEIITKYPRMSNAQEVADVRYAKTMRFDDGNHFDIDKVCIKETATKIGSGIVSREYAKAAPSPNYKKLNEEAQKVPKRVQKQQSAKCKLVRENSKPNYQQVEQEAKDLSYFIGKMKSEITDKNSNNKLVELKQEHLMNLSEMQKLQLNPFENINIDKQRINCRQPEQRVIRCGNHPNDPAKIADPKMMGPEKKLAEPTPLLPLTSEDKPPKPLIVDELMKNQIKIIEPNVIVPIMMQPLDEGNEVEKLNDRAKAAEQKFIRRKLRKEDQKQRNSVRDKTSSLEIQPRYDKSEHRLEEKVEIAKQFKRKIEELEIVLDTQDGKAPKLKEKPTGLKEIRYDEINTIAEKLINKNKRHRKSQSFTVEQLNRKKEFKKSTARIVEDELKRIQDKSALEGSYWRQKYEPDPSKTKIIAHILPETGKKDTGNVEDIASHPEPSKEEIDDNLTDTVSPQTIYPTVKRQTNLTEKPVVDDTKEIKTTDVIIEESNIDDGVLLKPGDEIVILESKQAQLIDSGNAKYDSEEHQNTRIKIDIMLQKIGELKEIIKAQNTQKNAENMPRVPPPSYRPQIDKDKKNKNIKGDPRPRELQDMIMPPRKTSTGASISKEPDNDKVGEKQVSGNITQANQVLRVESVSSKLLTNDSPGNTNKLPSLDEESIVKDYLIRRDNLKVGNILLPDNGYVINKINRPLELEKPKPLELENPKPLELEKPKPLELGKPKPLELEKPKKDTMEEGTLQDVEAKVEKKVETTFDNYEDLSLLHSTASVFNTITESKPKNTKIQQFVFAQEPKLNTKIIYRKPGIFANGKAALEKQVDDSKSSISKTVSSQRPLSAQNSIKQTTNRQVPVQWKNQYLTKKTYSNPNIASTNQIPTKKAPTNPIPPKKTSTIQNPEVSGCPNHEHDFSTNEEINCPAAKRKTMLLIMQSYESAKSSKRASSCPPKDSDNTKPGMTESKTKFSSWSTQNISSNNLEKNVPLESTQVPSKLRDVFSAIEPISKKFEADQCGNFSVQKKSSEFEPFSINQTKSILNAEASPQNNNAAASEEKPIIDESNMHKSTESQSIQLLHDAESKINKDINIENNFKPEQSEASFVEDGWVIGVKQLLAVNQDIINKNQTPETNKLKQELLERDKLEESKNEDANVNILSELKPASVFLAKNKNEGLCSADCNLCQDCPIAVLNITLPKLPSSEGKNEPHYKKFSAHAREIISKAGNRKTKPLIKNVTKAKDDKDRKSIFELKTSGKLSTIKKADPPKKKLIRATTSDPIFVKVEDADLTFKIQKLANQKVRDFYMTDEPQEDRELIIFNKGSIKRSLSDSKVKQNSGNDIHEEMMQLNRKYALALKVIEEKLAKKRQSLDAKALKIKQIEAIQKSPKENIAKLADQIETIQLSPKENIADLEKRIKSQQIEEKKIIQKSLRNVTSKSTPKVASMLRIKKLEKQFKYLKPAAEVPSRKSLLDDTVLRCDRPQTEPQPAHINKEAVKNEIKAWTNTININKRPTTMQSRTAYYEEEDNATKNFLNSYSLRKKKESELEKKNTMEGIQRSEYKSELAEKSYRKASRMKKDCVADLNTQADEMVRKPKVLYSTGKLEDAKPIQSSSGNASWGNKKLKNDPSSKNDLTGKRCYHYASSVSRDFNRLMSKREYLEFKRIEAEENKKKLSIEAGNKPLEIKTAATEMSTYKNMYGDRKTQSRTENRESVSEINKKKSDGFNQKTEKFSMQIQKKANQEINDKPVENKKQTIHRKETRNYYGIEEIINRFQAKKHSDQEILFKETEMQIYQKNYATVKTTKVQKPKSGKNPIQKEPVAVKPTLEIIYQQNIVNTEKDIVNTEKNIFTTEKNIVNTEKNIVNSKKNIVNTEKNIVNTEKNMVKTEKNLQKLQDIKNKAKTEKNLHTENNIVNTEKNMVKTEKNIQKLQDIKNKAKIEKNLHTENNIVNTEKNMVKTEKNIVKTEKSLQQLQQDMKNKILNKTVRNIETELVLIKEPLDTIEHKKIKEGLEKINKIKLAKSETKLIKSKMEKPKSATNKTKLEIYEIPLIPKKPKADLHMKVQYEVEAQKKLKLKVEPPELTTDAINFKIAKLTNLMIDDMILKKHAETKFLKSAKVDSKGPVKKKENKGIVVKSIIKSDLKRKASETTSNRSHKLHESATIDLLQKIDSKPAQKNPTTKKEIENKPKNVTQEQKSPSLGNLIKPKKANTAVTINMAKKDGKSSKKSEKDKKDKEETFILKRNLCKPPKRTPKTKTPLIKKAQNPTKKYGIKIVLPLRNIKEANKEFFESYESTLEKPVGDKIKVVPKEILDMEKKKKIAEDAFWEQMKHFNPNKYKHLRISYMTVKKRPKKQEKFLPDTTAQDMEEVKLSEEAKNRIINFRFELLRRLNEEFQKRCNEQHSNDILETSKVKDVNEIDKNTSKTMNSIGKANFYSKIIKSNKTPPKKPGNDPDNDNPKGVRRYSTNNNETDECCDKTDENKMDSSCASDKINNELMEKIEAYNISKVVPKAFEAASPKLEKQQRDNLYHRTHSWTYYDLNNYMHDQRVFSLDKAQKKKKVDSDKKDQKK